MGVADLQYNTIQYKTYNAPYVTKMLLVGVDFNNSPFLAHSIDRANLQLK